MSDDTNMTAIYQQFRTMMGSNLALGKKAYKQYVAGVERFLASMEDAGRLAWSGARDVNVRLTTFVDENARTAFESAERLGHRAIWEAPEEIAAVVSDFLTSSRCVAPVKRSSRAQLARLAGTVS
jgi:hypothetical protein